MDLRVKHLKLPFLRYKVVTGEHVPTLNSACSSDATSIVDRSQDLDVNHTFLHLIGLHDISQAKVSVFQPKQSNPESRNSIRDSSQPHISEGCYLLWLTGILSTVSTQW